MIKKSLLLIIIIAVAFISCEKKEEITYMGSRSCKECHEQFYVLWETSYHGRAMMDFSLEFAEKELSKCDAYIPSGKDAYQYKLKGGNAVMIERSSMKSYPIRYILGGKYVYYFLTPMDKGKLQTLPLGYDVKKKEWFDITASSLRIHQDIGDEALPWTDRRYTFNTACFACHVSQLTTSYNIQNDSYHTTWLEPGINCETCHGSAEEHVRIFTEALEKGTIPDSMYLKTFTQSRGYSGDIVNATCAYCHAKAIPLSSEYLPGEDFFQHYDLVGPEHPDFYPDGRDLGENYTYSSWLMSPCVRNSDMDCLHCHTSSGRFKQKDDPNAACLPCHAERVANATDHTKHQPTSSGNVCINCHMPKTTFARMTRSDHSMRPPVPAATRAYDSPNACNDCHTTESTEWAESFILEHYSGKYQKEIMLWADYLDQLRKGETNNLNDILPDMLRPVDEVTLSAMIRSLQNIHDERVIPLLLYFIKTPSPLVRASSATILGNYLNEATLNALYKCTKDPVRLVRVRAAAKLLHIPKNKVPKDHKESLNDAIKEYKSSLTAYPDQEISHFNLGHFHESAFEEKKAIGDYRRALKMRPEFTEASINLGMLYYKHARMDSALYFLQNAVIHDPDHADANLNLGLLYSELGYRDDAIIAFLTSFEQSRTAVAAYNLSVLYSKQIPEKSLKYAKNAFDLSSKDPKYIYTYAFYLSENGETPEAVNILEKALLEKITTFDIYYLLGSIYKHSENVKALEKLKIIIARDKDLTDRERRYLKFN